MKSMGCHGSSGSTRRAHHNEGKGTAELNAQEHTPHSVLFCKPAFNQIFEKRTVSDGYRKIYILGLGRNEIFKRSQGKNPSTPRLPQTSKQVIHGQEINIHHIATTCFIIISRIKKNYFCCTE